MQEFEHFAECCERCKSSVHYMQVALVAASVYTFVEVLAACLFLATRDSNNNGYYPSNGMVTAHLAVICCLKPAALDCSAGIDTILFQLCVPANKHAAQSAQCL